MTKKLDISIGQQFGRWVVTGITRHAGRLKYDLLCSCGNVGRSESSHLVKGLSKSCGCYHKEIVGNSSKTHGMSGTPTYKSWEMMIQRCTNLKYAGYDSYGGVGVQVCDRWLNSFENFYEDMGERPDGTTLNRKIGLEGNVSKIYSLETCEWASLTTQGYDRGVSSNNTSGRTGVSFNVKTNRWRAYITKGRKRECLGSFTDFNLAVKAREEAEIRLYGYCKN